MCFVCPVVSHVSVWGNIWRRATCLNPVGTIRKTEGTIIFNLLIQVIFAATFNLMCFHGSEFRRQSADLETHYMMQLTWTAWALPARNTVLLPAGTNL